MTSLYPGMLFYSSGLNKKSTPYGPEVTPSEIEQKLGRVPFNGRPWPKSSPVSTVYDVRNSSTRMIILNNKLSRRPKGSRLRGQSDYQGEIQHPEPFRHVTEESHTNWEHHKGCTTSVSEKFIPVFPRGVSPLPAWVNKTQRPAMKFDNGSGVNPNHHIQCQGHIDYDIVRWYNNHRRPRAQSRTSSMRDSRAISPILNDPNLSRGEKRYLNSIAKIYSVDNMRQQKQIQYNQLMYREMNKGLSKQTDWQKYHRYLNTPRKTQFGPCDPKRSQSVTGNRSKKESTDEPRPNTTQTGARVTKGSRDASTSGSARRGYNPKAQPNQKGGRDNNRKKNEDLTGKPARVESPLPLKPRRDSLSSLSSLSDVPDQEEEEDRKKDKGEESKPKEEEKQKQEQQQVSPPQERGKRDDNGNDKVDQDAVDGKTKRNDDSGDKKEEETRNSDDDKRKEDDEDERSKMSARAEDDQPGRGVEYVPVYGERQGEDGNERSVANGDRKKSTEHQSEPEKPEHFRPKTPEDDKNKAAAESSSENPVVLLPPATNEKRTSDSDKSQDDDSNGPELIHHLHKEGGDRPLSRLGGRGQFTLVKKGSDANSDDDYSDDDEKTVVDGNATDQQRGDNQENETENGGGTDVRLSLHKEGDGAGGANDHNNADDNNTAGAATKDSPSGNSSQEKHSTITTVEY